MAVRIRGGEGPEAVQGRIDLGREPQRALVGELVEELRHEGLEPMRTDVAGGLPQDLHRRGHGGARRSNRIAALRCRPVPATPSSSWAPFSARVAAR
jgi:hypothetical protein